MPKKRTDSGQGWIRREFATVKRMIRESNAAKRLESASIGKGGLVVREGGRIAADYPSGIPAVQFGPSYRNVNGDLVWGISIFRPDSEQQYQSIFTAYTYDDENGLSVIDGDSDFAYFTATEEAGMRVGSHFMEANQTCAIMQYTPSSGFPNFVQVDNSGVSIQAVTGTHRMPGMGTTSSGANMYIDFSTGAVKVSTSTLREKRDVEDAALDTDAALGLQPRRFRRIDEVEELGDAAPTYVGFIAEEAAALGLDDWVTNDEEGLPKAFSYSSWVVALQAVCQRQAEQITDLTARVEALEGQQ